jgi:SpoVK/Ycf46/Vps4 family AAA+-type ATPase
VTGLSECLRRVVNKLATHKQGVRFRERVAVEIAVTARARPDGLVAFKPHLDRIAGTRVL